MRKNSFGQSVLVVLVFVLVLFLIGTLGKTSEPKCIKAGCDNKRASGSDYCYIHKPSSSYHSTPSDSTSSDSKDSYSKPSDSGVTDSNTEKTEQTTEYTNSEILAAVQQNITIMIHMMMDMMTFIWTETTIQTGTIQMPIMQKA